MRTLSQALQHPLPDVLPPPAAMLYGYVDTSEAGYRSLKVGATTYTIPAALSAYRADELATALTTAGAPTTHAGGLYTVTPASSMSLTAPDRLAVIMGLTQEASLSPTASATSFTSQRIAPVAIPIAGFYTQSHRVDADDERLNDRMERDMGYTWGAARVLTVRLTLHKWALDAWLFGWCQRGKVTLVGNLDDILEGLRPNGRIDGRVMSTTTPTWLGEAQLWAEVSMTLAVEEP
jgi:hypothetical protein